MDLSPSHPSSDTKLLCLCSKHILGKYAKCSALASVRNMHTYYAISQVLDMSFTKAEQHN